jgi:hypothetical protein
MEQEQIRMELQSECIDVPKEYRPSKQESLSRYEINIQFMSRGCVIRVGCKSIPFSSTDEAISELQKYFENPYDTQESWHRQLN